MDPHSCKQAVEIIYEDDWLVVANKPSGLLVIPTPKREANTFTNILNRDFQQKTPSLKLYPCHRLDRETSGLIIYAKGKNNQRLMMNQFKTFKVKKKYIGLVQGKLKKPFGRLQTFIDDNPRYWKKSRENRSKLAITEFRVLKDGRDFSALEIFPITGRTNQIRIQFQAIGHPLLGERRFTVAKNFKIKFRRVALHALSLEFKHPITHKIIKLSSNLPQDMSSFIKTKFSNLEL